MVVVIYPCVNRAESGRGTMAQGLADIVHGDPFGAGNAGIAVVGTLGRISETKE